MEQAFKIIDLDGDNYISKQELEVVMGGIEEDVKIKYIQRSGNLFLKNAIVIKMEKYHLKNSQLCCNLKCNELLYYYFSFFFLLKSNFILQNQSFFILYYLINHSDEI